MPSTNEYLSHVGSAEAHESSGEFFVDIDFPTGEVVYADWPDRFSEIRDEGYLYDNDGSVSINFPEGQRLVSEEFAKQGVLHMYVGNSCPGLYINPDNHRIRIGKTSKGYKKVGYFCTDLWWVTMLDKSRYEEMLSKLPRERSERYHINDVVTTKIKPGRYRFFTVPQSEDSDHQKRLFVRATYIGPCGEIPKLQHVSDRRLLLTPKQMLSYQDREYSSKSTRFIVMDQLFNVIGNGIKSKGSFLTHISVPRGAVIPDTVLQDEVEELSGEAEVVVPYPNFEKRYSLIGVVPVKDIPTEWLEEMAWFYNECFAFFDGPNVSEYAKAYPSKNGRANVELWEGIVERYKEGRTEAEFHSKWIMDYGVEYTGDIDKFLTLRWEKELARIHRFINETLAEIYAELTLR